MIKLGFASMLAVSMLTFTACDGDDDGTGDGDGTGGADAAPGGADAGPTTDAGPNDYQVLMQGDWSLNGGEEGYRCVIVTLPEEIFIKAFRPLIPQGTHHTVLTIYTGSDPDGITTCSAGTNGQRMIYGSGVGSPDFAFPPTIGLKLPAGTRLLLNLHLYNTLDTVLTGTSGVLVQKATASEIEHEAEVVLAGPAGFTVPTGMQTVTGDCSIKNITNEPIFVFARSQHMHKLGINLKTTIIRAGQEIAFQDEPYNFDEQSFEYMDPVFELKPGDKLRTECTYLNDTGSEVMFGDSSDNEMCFTDIFYYPAQGANFLCLF